MSVLNVACFSFTSYCAKHACTHSGHTTYKHRRRDILSECTQGIEHCLTNFTVFFSIETLKIHLDPTRAAEANYAQINSPAPFSSSNKNVLGKTLRPLLMAVKKMM